MTSEQERLAILVHEVRSPVAALSAIAEAFPGTGGDADGRRSLAGLAIAACRGIERVVTDAAAASVRPAPLDLSTVVRAAVDAVALHGASIRAEVDDELPRVQADAVRVRQALDNLVGNALAHGGPEVSITVRAWSSGEEVLVSVSDDGPGIPEAEHDRIFEPGVSLDDAGSGWGLGLALVEAIADAHGARLELDSAPGRGSTFVLAFPRLS